MRLATRDNGTPDGELLVIAPDGSRALPAAGWPNLLAAIGDWAAAERELSALAKRIANDAGGYYRRPLGDRIAGEADFNAPGRARQLRAEFEQAWARPRPVTEYRALGI